MPAEHTLDYVAAFVGALIVAMRMFSSGIGRDDRLDAAPFEFLAQAVGIVGPVGQEALGARHHRDEFAGTDQIVGVAGRDQQGDGAPDLVRQRVDFGRLAATRAPDGIIEGSPFAPAAERWTLM